MLKWNRGPKQILIVDDEPGIRSLLERILVEEGYDVLTASDGNTAISMLKHKRISVLFLDLMMPPPDGFDILHFLRTFPKRPIIVVISGIGSDDFLETLKKAYPIYYYLHKPFNVEDVRKLLAKFNLERNVTIIKKMLDWKHWLYGLFGGFIGGGATAGVSWFGMLGAKAVGMDVPDLNFQALGVIFLSGGISSALLFLKQSPFPQEIEIPMDTITTTVKTVTQTPSHTEPPKENP